MAPSAPIFEFQKHEEYARQSESSSWPNVLLENTFRHLLGFSLGPSTSMVELESLRTANFDPLPPVCETAVPPAAWEVVAANDNVELGNGNADAIDPPLCVPGFGGDPYDHRHVPEEIIARPYNCTFGHPLKK